MTESDDLIREFLIESHEGLDRLDQDLVELEKDPRNRETLASVFRAIHTIKGTCGFLGFGKLEGVSHVGESLLSRLRDGEMVLDASITTALLGMVDAIREILAFIESTGGEGDADYTAVIERLQALNERRAATADEPAVTMPPSPVVPHVEIAPIASAPVPVLEAVVLDEPDPLPADDRGAGEDRKQGVSDSSLRVDVGLLDKLMNLVGELVLARNQILQFTHAPRTTPSFVGATAAAEPAHHRAAGRRHEDPHAADRQRLEQVPARRPRPRRRRAASRSASRWKARRPSSTRRSSRRSRTRSRTSSATPSTTASSRRPSASPRGKPAEGRAAAARLPRGRPGHHRDRRRRRRHRRRARCATRRVERGLITAEQAARHVRPRVRQADLPARASRPPRRSPTSPAAASAWTWSRPTSRRSAARSTSRARPGRARRSRSRSRSPWRSSRR